VKHSLTVLAFLVTFSLTYWCLGQQEFGLKKRKVMKTDQEWQKILTRNQFLVTRRKETEPAFSGKLVNNHAKGVYVCVCCGEELFSSRTKFNSGTGWPSFYAAIAPGQIDTAPDYSAAEPRVEVECTACGAHLGHVFEDGPPPTGLRYCINSLSLRFVKATTAATTKEKSKSKVAKGKAKDTPSKDTGQTDSDTPKDEGKGESKPADEKAKSESSSK
jgi:peptide-methionine (R)-S-oxide reductase